VKNVNNLDAIGKRTVEDDIIWVSGQSKVMDARKTGVFRLPRRTYCRLNSKQSVELSNGG